MLQQITDLSNTEKDEGQWFPLAAVSENNLFRDGRGRKLKRGELYKTGMIQVRDFFDADGRLLDIQGVRNLGLQPRYVPEWLRARTAIAARIVGQNDQINGLKGMASQRLLNRHTNADLFECIFPTKDGLQDLSAMTHKQRVSLSQTQEDVACGKKTENWLASCGATRAQLLEALLQVKKTSIDTNLRSFHLRLLNGILYSNKDYARFGFKPLDKCDWCQETAQSVKHLLWDCNAAQAFRKRVAHLNNSWNLSQRQALVPNQANPTTFLAVLIKRYSRVRQSEDLLNDKSA